MCSMIGVDPLASTRDVGANGVLGEGMEQFYWELAVRVVEVCRKFREENGGVMEVGEVREVIEGRQKRVDGGLVGGGGISE
jgi:ESCRT-II complex subunit VPS22